MNKTGIEWTDFSVNPFRFRNLETGKVGHHCVKISPGCKNCYSSKMQTGPYLSGLEFIAENKAKGEFFLDEAVLQQVLRRKKPARIFWCDMTDMFLDDYPDEWIDRCFAVMALTPHLTHQVLTKRSKRLREYFADSAFRAEMIGIVAEYRSGLDRYTRGSDETTGSRDDLLPTWSLPLPNVWLGISAEDQQHADERIPDLLATPAAVRFISAEPLLGPVDIERYLRRMVIQSHEELTERMLDAGWSYRLGQGDHPPLDWVIVGGESGPGPRPFDIAWPRSIVKQCKAAEVACFVKQFGANVIDRNDAGFDGDTPSCWPMDTAWAELDSGYQGAPVRVLLDDRKGGSMEEWPEDTRVRQMPKASR